MSKKRSKQENSVATAMWENMPWKPVSIDHSELGNFEDSVFWGLEELDGNSYVFNKSQSGYSVAPVAVGEKKAEKTKKRVSLKALRKQNASLKVAGSDEDAVVETNNFMRYGTESWGGIELHGLLSQSLIRMGFELPTPIQQQAIPLIMREKHDVVGAAETGSGKTLAFCLPVLNHILNGIQGEHSVKEERTRCPRALIIAPTRELALQITAVIKEVCNSMRAIDAAFPCKINVVAVVGGMAEQKQRRLLSARSAYVDIIVGTPGRLCELVQDDEIVVFQNMSRLRFLIVDEADRIVEEGHFPEVCEC